MWARAICLAACIAACYAPRVAPGTPCDEQCPFGLTCALVDGVRICVDMPPDTTPDGSVNDGWTLVQTGGATSRTLTLPAPASAGTLIIVALETTSGALPNEVSDDAGNKYERLATSRARHNVANLGVELWIATSEPAGATKIETKGGIVRAVVAWEVAGLDTKDPIAAIAHEDNAADTDMPRGPEITTDAPGQFVVSVAIVANRIDRIADASAFTNDQSTLNNGWAHLTDRHAPAATYQAAWLQPELGGYCATSAAFRVKP